MNDFEFQQSTTSGEAIRSVAQNENAFFLAGGTNLLDLWKYDIAHPELLVDINNIDAAEGVIEKQDGGIQISATLTNAHTAYHPIIEERYPLLSKAILAGASAQIRNMASNGGNLLQRTRCYYFYDPHVPCNKREPGSGCSAIEGYNRIHAILGASDACIAVFPSDMCVALSALNAVVNIKGPDEERSMPFADFHRLPGETPNIDNNLSHGELITSIDLPQEGYAQHYSYLKLRDRHSYAFALVSVATGLALDGNTISSARIALGGVAHKPWRSIEAEDFLRGKPASGENFSAAADIILNGAKGYKYNSFKIELAKEAIIRNCLMALDPASQVPGAGPSK